MKFTFEDLGWYFAWDKEGKYPIDVNNPIPVPPDGTVTVWLTNKPVQQEDGSWVQWFVVEGNGERLLRHYALYWFFWRWINADYFDPFTILKTFIVAGDKVKNKFNIDNLNGFAVEEMFYGYSADNENLLNSWPNSGNKIADFVDINNGVYIKFADFKNKLGGSSNTGDVWIEFSEIPPFINGVNYEMCDLTYINAKLQNFEYKKNQTIAFLAKILKDKDEDVVLFNNQMLKVYWNNEDYGIYIDILPPVGEIKTFKLNSSPLEIGEYIYFVLIKNGNTYKAKCNEKYTEFTYEAVDYVEEYVKNDNSINIEYINKSVSYASPKVTTDGRDCSWPDNDRWTLTMPTFAPNKNRGSFINADYISKLINYPDLERIKTPGEISTTDCDSDFFKAVHTELYTPQQIKLSNVTRPIYISAILNPARMTGVVKRIWYVENNELKYRDEIYAV